MLTLGIRLRIGVTCGLVIIRSVLMLDSTRLSLTVAQLAPSGIVYTFVCRTLKHAATNLSAPGRTSVTWSLVGRFWVTNLSVIVCIR